MEVFDEYPGGRTLIFEFINGKNLQQHLNNHPNGLPRDTVRNCRGHSISLCTYMN